MSAVAASRPQILAQTLARRQTFGRGGTLALLLVGVALFGVFLWYLGNGGPSANNGGGHAGGRGLNGFAGLAALVQADGQEVTLGRGAMALKTPGLLVLTPLADAKGSDIEQVVVARRHIGPTLVVSPKWQAMPVPAKWGKPRGWTVLTGLAPPQWPGFLDDVEVDVARTPAHGWHLAEGTQGPLPFDKVVLSGKGDHLVPLVRAADGRILAAYVDDSGRYRALGQLAGQDVDAPGFGGRDEDLQPLVVVFEPDLLDNAGLADRRTAMLALRLIAAASAKTSERGVTFDLTLAGVGARRNLLTLAFEPPFLGATVVLVLALLAVGWRAWCRFGPVAGGALVAGEMAGRGALVANSAGLIRRARRLHLLTGPYAQALRERIAARLGLPRGATMALTDAAIDRALNRQGDEDASFAQVAQALAQTRNEAEAVRLAMRLHEMEQSVVKGTAE
ncbi:MAG: DUF4350 domain-containing protein [Novosphingobium aromaticivorans]|nr:DUF4350 domain-containing protein [Novosphingobium aromaticivorans]